MSLKKKCSNDGLQKHNSKDITFIDDYHSDYSCTLWGEWKLKFNLKLFIRDHCHYKNQQWLSDRLTKIIQMLLVKRDFIKYC